MKKILLLPFLLLMLMQMSFGQQKTVVGLTDTEIVALQNNNPDFKIDLSNYSENTPQYFATFEIAQLYIDSLRSVLREKSTVTDLKVQVSSPNGKFAPCGCGDYYVSNIGQAGFFSTFNFTFNYCNGNVSNGSIGASGPQIGWTLGSTSGSYSGLYGCSTVTVTFGIGIFSWSQTVRFRFHFNPNSCELYFTPVTNGNCATILSL